MNRTYLGIPCTGMYLHLHIVIRIYSVITVGLRNYLPVLGPSFLTVNKRASSPHWHTIVLPSVSPTELMSLVAVESCLVTDVTDAFFVPFHPICTFVFLGASGARGWELYVELDCALPLMPLMPLPL